MAKHNKTKKRNIRKRVRRNAQKIKEIKAEDIIMNPSIVYSPQFQQLPKEKQFMLMTQVKQIKAMMGNRPNGPAYTSSGNSGGDPVLLSRINDINNKASRQANENEQLRIGLQAANDALKHQKDLEKQIKFISQQQTDSINQQAKIDGLQQQLDILNSKKLDTQSQQLEKEIRDIKHEANIDNINQKQKELAKVSAQLNQIKSALGQSEGMERMTNERYKQAKDDDMQDKQIFQNQIIAYDANGLMNKSQAAEQHLYNQANDTQDIPLKKNLTTDDTPTENAIEDGDIWDSVEDIPAPQLSNVETNGIVAEVNLDSKIQTRQEQIKQADEVLKQKQRNQQAAELLIAQNTNKPPETHMSRLNLEQEKAKLIEEVNEIIKSMALPDMKYFASVLRQIDDATTFQEIKLIGKSLDIDKNYIEEEIKQQEYNEKKQKELNKIQRQNQLKHKNLKEDLDKIRQENQQQYERLKEESKLMKPDDTNSEMNLETAKKKAYEELEAVMKIPDNPNNFYRERLAWEIKYAQTMVQVKDLLNKLTLDKQYLEEEEKKHEAVVKQQKHLIDRLNKPRKPPKRFEYPLEIWKAKILQAQTPEDIYNVAQLMKAAKYAVNQISNYNQAQTSQERRKWANSAKKGKETLKQIEQYLQSSPQFEKRILFYDGHLVKNLKEELQILSPSDDHNMVDFRAYKKEEPKNKRWYLLWLL